MSAILGNAMYVEIEFIEPLPLFKTKSPSTCSLNVLGATISHAHYASTYMLTLEYCYHGSFLSW